MIVDRNSPIPQYFQLQTWLIEQIDQGVIKPGDRIPTEEELTRITGLARATVRQATQNLVNMGYLLRKRRLGTFVCERKKSQGKANIIGVLVPDIRSGYAPELARGAGDEASKSRHSILLCNTDDTFVRADFHADRLIELSVGGVVFVPTAAPDDKNKLIVEKFLRHNIPVVLADRSIPGMDMDLITTDNFEGARTITGHLIGQGHRRIAISLSMLFSTERERLEGYRKALEDHGIPYDPTLVFTGREPFSEQRTLHEFRTILSSKPDFTALFAGHDRIAFAVQTAAEEAGIRIPGDLSLVGYDDLAALNPPPVPLTTMHQPIYEMGQESMKRIILRMQDESSGPRTIVLESHLVERSSVARLGPSVSRNHSPGRRTVLKGDKR
jgi:DNA-binding LacI/PurR family transcriptional regulator